MAVELFLCSCYPAKKKKNNWHQTWSWQCPAFQGLLANILNSLFSTQCLLHAAREISTEGFWRRSYSQQTVPFCGQERGSCCGTLVMSGSLFPPGGDSDQIWWFVCLLFFSKWFWGQNVAVMTAFLPVSEKADVPSEQGWLLYKHSAFSDKNTLCFLLNKTTQLCLCYRQEHQTSQTSAVFEILES